MGFLTKLMNVLTGETPIPNNEPINISKLDESITLKLQTMKNELLIAKETFPNEAGIIEEKIQLLEENILQGYPSVSLEESFQELQELFIPLKEKSQEKAVFDEVALFKKELDSLFWGNSDDPAPITNELLDQAGNKLKLLAEKATIFSGEQANLYLIELAKLEYRLSCCQMIKDSLTYFPNSLL